MTRRLPDPSEISKGDSSCRGSFRASLAGAGILASIVAVFLCSAAPAWANIEQVATFGTTGEARQLMGSKGFAINTTGAGGVAAGTVYTVDAFPARVARYGPDGSFSEAWGGGVAVNGNSDEFQRCGPDGDPAFPECESTFSGSNALGGEGKFYGPDAIAVDQTTGDVYVLQQNRGVENTPEKPAVQIFSAQGNLITSFGETGSREEPVEDNPALIHDSHSSGLAVSDSGVVYISDGQGAGGEGSRVMTFEPESPGDYEHYVYGGRSRDIAVSHGSTKYLPQSLALDAAGNLYVGAEEKIYAFAPSDRTAPVCEYRVAVGGVSAMTVNPETGEVFYFTEKDRQIHQLSACNAKGEFGVVGAISLTPKTKIEVLALAFNPTLTYSASRPAGALYAADGGYNPEEGREGRGYIFAPAEVRFPVVVSESATSVTSSTALLGAQINPTGSTTRFVFQYLTDGAYRANEEGEKFADASEVPSGGGILGSGQIPLSALGAATDLQAETEYHFRVIATSHCEPSNPAELCETVGPGQTFRTYPPELPGLPDDRAYELVSPARKNGGEVLPLSSTSARCLFCQPSAHGTVYPMESSPNGETVVYEGFPFSGEEGASGFNEYLAKRSATGWQTTFVSPALQRNSQGEGPVAFDRVLSQDLIYQGMPALAPSAPSEYSNLYLQQTASPLALSPLLTASPENRTPGSSFKMVYAGASADFSHIFFGANDALTRATAFAPESVDGGVDENNLYESSDGELNLVNVLPNGETIPGASFDLAPHAVSDDGSRVFWSSEAGQVYVREHAEITQEIPDPSSFLTASADGSKVLLQDGDLYNVEDLAEAPIDLTQGEGGFKGIAGQSESLSRIYFVDSNSLAGPNAEGKEPNEGGVAESNLYLWNEGATTFVATLKTIENQSESGVWSPLPSSRSAEASPDGRWLAFQSRARLTGYENVGADCFRNSSGEFKEAACPENFVFDSADEKLVCASCNPSGALPLGPSGLPGIELAPASLPQPRYVLDSGRVYFNTQDSLSPFDTNEGEMDVYQYEPKGTGTCTKEFGCISLISAGNEPAASNFLSVDSTGKNVFFTTRDQLTALDRDDVIDLYDAREGGGIAAETETARSECQGEACQSVPVVPNDSTPASSSFEGAGNVNEKPSKPKQKKKKHKRNKKHKKHKKHKQGAKSHKRSAGRSASNHRGGTK